MDYYCDARLNKNHVLYATPDMYSSQGAEELLKEYRDDNPDFSEWSDYDLMNYFVDIEYDDIQINFSDVHVGPTFLAFRIKRWNGVFDACKIIYLNKFPDIIQSYGCDSFAYYYDSYNLNYMGYHHDSDCIPNTGVIREVKSGVDTSTLCDRYMSAKDKKAFLSKYTKSLVPYIHEVYGKPFKKK